MDAATVKRLLAEELGGEDGCPAHSAVWLRWLPLSPGFISCVSFRISVVPPEILVVMQEAWKEEVFSGHRPVFWAGTETSHRAMAQAWAAAGTLLSSSTSLISGEVLPRDQKAHMPVDMR